MAFKCFQIDERRAAKSQGRKEWLAVPNSFLFRPLAASNIDLIIQPGCLCLPLWSLRLGDSVVEFVAWSSSDCDH